MAEKQIQVPALQRKIIIVTVKAITPIITNRFSEAQKGKIEDKQQQKAKQGRKPREPQKEYEASRYPMGDNGNRFGFPATGFKKAMVRAGKLFDMPMTDTRQMFHIIPADGETLLEIEDSKSERRDDTVRLQNGAAEIRYRAQFKNWRIKLPIRFNPTLISEEQIINLVNQAGDGVGVGDWRPEHNGTFGMFEVEGNAVLVQ